MATARYKDVCLDATDPVRLGQFWARALDRLDEVDEGGVAGPTPQHRLWLNPVPEPKTVKHRAHFDIYTHSLADLEALGATVVRPAGEGRRWTVMADPEGGEFCAFLRDELPVERMHGLVIDSIDPAAQARWWAGVYGATIEEHEDKSYATVVDVAGMPILTMDFVPVPEPKTVKNRVHWDVSVESLQALLDAGATLLRPADDEIRWNIMADPEGNEFCAFVEKVNQAQRAGGPG